MLSGKVVFVTSCSGSDFNNSIKEKGKTTPTITTNRQQDGILHNHSLRLPLLCPSPSHRFEQVCKSKNANWLIVHKAWPSWKPGGCWPKARERGEHWKQEEGWGEDSSGVPVCCGIHTPWEEGPCNRTQVIMPLQCCFGGRTMSGKYSGQVPLRK